MHPARLLGTKKAPPEAKAGGTALRFRSGMLPQLAFGSSVTSSGGRNDIPDIGSIQAT